MPVVLLDAIDFIWLSDVQLVAFRDLLEVCALVECTAEAGLPHGGVSFIPSLPVFALIHSPGLNGKIEILDPYAYINNLGKKRDCINKTGAIVNQSLNTYISTRFFLFFFTIHRLALTFSS